jgi:hypothetical protein
MGANASFWRQGRRGGCDEHNQSLHERTAHTEAAAQNGGPKRKDLAP